MITLPQNDLDFYIATSDNIWIFKGP